MGLDSVSECLDQQLIQFMDQLELLEEKRHRLNTLIEEGWFNIAKARYSMGNKQVSALQYANEIEPLVHVYTSPSDEGKLELKCERTDHKLKELKESATVETIGPADGGVRKRLNVQQKKDDNNEEERDNTESQLTRNSNSDTSSQTPSQHQDPLKWFGILVPQNLKTAQAAFKDVIYLAAEISSLQIAILNTKEKMQMQMKQKQESS